LIKLEIALRWHDFVDAEVQKPIEKMQSVQPGRTK
jgi:hypothetical protein